MIVLTDQFRNSVDCYSLWFKLASIKLAAQVQPDADPGDQGRA